MKDLVINDDWKIVELGITLDASETYIPMMPETVDSDTQISGMDGEINLSTTYGPRNMELVGYSDEGLTSIEKIEFKDRIARFLHQYKNKPFRLVIKPYNRSYDVKYSGAIENENYPGSVKVSIPLKSSSSFGYVNTETVLTGKKSYTITSKTVEPVGFILTIEGPVGSPVFTVNGEKISLTATASENEKIVYNTKNSTIVHIDAQGKETNILAYNSNVQFPKIVEGENTLTISDESFMYDVDKIEFRWYDLTF